MPIIDPQRSTPPCPLRLQEEEPKEPASCFTAGRETAAVWRSTSREISGQGKMSSVRLSGVRAWSMDALATTSPLELPFAILPFFLKRFCWPSGERILASLLCPRPGSLSPSRLSATPSAACRVQRTCTVAGPSSSLRARSATRASENSRAVSIPRPETETCQGCLSRHHTGHCQWEILMSLYHRSELRLLVHQISIHRWGSVGAASLPSPSLGPF